MISNERYHAASQHYMQLPHGAKIQCEYIWIGGFGNDLRSKGRTLNGPIKSSTDIPVWNYDGSSTNQAPANESEIWLRSVKIIKDPFRGGDNILSLCECLTPDMDPIPTNKRSVADKIFGDPRVDEQHPWYGLEQEYTMFERDGVTPLGWPVNGFPRPQGPYYCSVGTRNAVGRQVAEAHYRACLYAGLTICGINAEVMPGQWEYQIGPVEGIDASDELWLSRYILERISEEFNVVISYSPKPVEGNWNGAGCHTNFSTLSMREPGGIERIIEGIKKLEGQHGEHMKYYGKGNEKRMLGSHETCRYDEFRYGVGDRGASVRIPTQTNNDGCGYFEDRRPAANCDPYEVTSILARAIILE